ncbi:FLJ37770-like protein, partial [Acromyrmex echinatior]
SAPSRTTVYRWFSEFKMGCTSTEDTPRSGRPKEATNAEIAKQVHRIVLSDRKMKLRELTEAVGISKERAGYILHDVLEMKKLSARWVPRLLIIDQKQQRIDDSTTVWRCCSVIERTFFDVLFTSNEEVITETEAYFEGLDVSYYRKGIEMLENRYTKCIVLEGNYIEE